MNRFSSSMSQLFNPVSAKELSEIDKKIDKELGQDEVNEDAVNKLILAKRYKSMELGTIYGRDYRAMYPY